MNELEREMPADFENSNVFLRDYNQLRKFFSIALIATLVMAVSVNVFFVRQVIFARKDLETVRPQLSLLLSNYQKVEDPQIQNFIGALVNYSRSHPDFNPILAKYKIAPGTAILPVSPVATPGVTPVAPTKKK